MQLAVKNKFISLNEALVKYRVHSGSLTPKTISKWAQERRYTLGKIIRDNMGIDKKHKKAFKEAYARAAYYETQYHMSRKDKKNARKVMHTYCFSGWRYMLIYSLTFMPMAVWNWSQYKKYNRRAV